MSMEKSVDDTATEAAEAAEAAGARTAAVVTTPRAQFGRVHASAVFNMPSFTISTTRAQLENLLAAAMQTKAGATVGNVGSLRCASAPTTSQVAPAYSMNTMFGEIMEWEKHSSPAS